MCHSMADMVAGESVAGADIPETGTWFGAGGVTEELPLHPDNTKAKAIPGATAPKRPNLKTKSSQAASKRDGRSMTKRRYDVVTDCATNVAYAARKEEP